MQQQIQHLDQLHTQTRGLLVRQSEIINNLRPSTAWLTWAQRLHRVMCGGERAPDDVDELRMGIEEMVMAPGVRKAMLEKRRKD